MKLSAIRNGLKYTTCYMATIGCKEAREAGFLRDDGSGRFLTKEVDPESGTITLRVDWEAEKQQASKSDAE